MTINVVTTVGVDSLRECPRLCQAPCRYPKSVQYEKPWHTVVCHFITPLNRKHRKAGSERSLLTDMYPRTGEIQVVINTS